VVVTNTLPQVIERERIVMVTNQATGMVSGYVEREPVATNLVTLLVTNTIPGSNAQRDSPSLHGC
jgi:hypothetical protein